MKYYSGHETQDFSVIPDHEMNRPKKESQIERESQQHVRVEINKSTNISE
jgi:hypothetical protein